VPPASARSPGCWTSLPREGRRPANRGAGRGLAPPHGCNRLAYPCHLVGFAVIAPYHRPAPQLGHQPLRSKGQQGRSGHNACHPHGRHHPSQAHRSDHRDRSPAGHRRRTGGTLPTRGTAIGPGLVAAGFGAKPQSRGLNLLPRLAAGGVLTLALGRLLCRGVKRFFGAGAGGAPRRDASWPR
jgi:hypothetical protein